MKNTLTILLLSAVFLTGCATVGRKLDQSAVDQIKKGVTTRDQVIQLIGSPDQVTRTGDGLTTFQYMYSRASAKAVNFVPVVNAFAGGVNVQNQMVMVTFGSDGVVSDIFSTYGGNEVNTGVTSGSSAKLPGTTENKRPQ
jgi:outer membrane protein assembly factor BamE (lipoprotein component of BamABCDE complex)